MSRWKAAAIHLSISAAIGLIAAMLIFGLWYPPPYSEATGALELVMLLLGVDLILGPLLTLTVFRAGKKGLKFDLIVIAAMQACAFLYGMSVVTRARPVFIVATIDRFVLVSANDLDPADLAEGREPEFRSLPWTGPRLVGATMPTDAKERTDLLFSGLAGKDLERYPKYYVDYARVAQELLRHAQPLDALRQKLPQSARVLEDWLQRHKRSASEISWLPMTSNHTDMTTLLDAKTGAVVDSLPMDPW